MMNRVTGQLFFAEKMITVGVNALENDVNFK
jgi:hypothetical protein